VAAIGHEPSNCPSTINDECLFGGSMKTRISFHNLEKAAQEELGGMIDELARRHVELQIYVDKNRHRNFYRVSETLAVPGATLTRCAGPDAQQLAPRDMADPGRRHPAIESGADDGGQRKGSEALDPARRRLPARRLREAGYRPVDEGKLPAYFMPTPATATPELAQALDAVTKGAK
jgi:hypothetical protein